MTNEKAAAKPFVMRVIERIRTEREENMQPKIKHYEITPALIISYIVMFAFALITLVPLLWMIRTALVPSADALQLFKLSAPTLDNIKSILNSAPFGQYYLNTIFMVAAVLLVQFISITLAGYAFARIDFYGKNFLFMLFLTQMMVSADVLIMPNYKFISRLGLADTKIGVILPFFASAMGILMMRQTVKTIPYELEEAAKIDGCGMLRIITTIYVPLLKPVYIAFGLVSASYQWNNFLWPLVMINSEKNRPLTLGLAIFAMAAETGANWSATCAATFIVVLPLLVVFIIFQKQFMQSFATSGIK
ncbi:MAG: carbohydrate ABC transporter permease [Oscillospiraceae bacterium]